MPLLHGSQITYLDEVGPEKPNGFLGKPYRATALRAKLAAVLAG